jgi:hypothetical protein
VTTSPEHAPVRLDHRDRDPLRLVRTYPWVASLASSVTLAAYALNWATAGEVTWAHWSLVLLGAAEAQAVLMLPFYYRVFDRGWRAETTAVARARDEPSPAKRAEWEQSARKRTEFVMVLPFTESIYFGVFLGLEIYDLATGGAPWAHGMVILLIGSPLPFFVIRDLYRSAFATTETAAG